MLYVFLHPQQFAFQAAVTYFQHQPESCLFLSNAGEEKKNPFFE